MNYVMSFVSWGFMSRTPPGHVELVDISLPGDHQPHQQPTEVDNHKGNTTLIGNGSVNATHLHSSSNGNERVVLYPPAPTTNPAGEVQAEDEAVGLAILSKNPCKSLSTVSSDSAVGEYLSRDPEITWAVQVLDNLIGLAKQWHTTPKQPKLEPFITSPQCKTLAPVSLPLDQPEDKSRDPISDSNELYLPKVGLPGVKYSLDEVDVKALQMENETFKYSSPEPRVLFKQSFMEQEGRETSLTSLELPELETVFSDRESSDEEETTPRHYPLQMIVEDPETDQMDDIDEDTEKLDRFRKLTSSTACEHYIKLEEGMVNMQESAAMHEDRLHVLEKNVPPTITAHAIGGEHVDLFQDEKTVENLEKLGHEGTAVAMEDVVARKKKLELLIKVDVSNVLISEPLVEEREMRYPSPKMTELEIQDEPSFRLWECESPPKRRRSLSVSRDFQELDTQDSEYIRFGSMESQNVATRKTLYEHLQQDPDFEEIRKEFEQFPPQSLKEFETSATSTDEEKVLPNAGGGEEDSQYEYPSPSSFTYQLSPSSIFSDDLPPLVDAFPTDIPARFRNRGQPELEAPHAGTFTYRESLASVLSKEPDEMLHMTSDSSEQKYFHPHRCYFTSTYRDESTSDAESLLEGYGSATKGGACSDTGSLGVETFGKYSKPTNVNVMENKIQHAEFEKPFLSKFTYTAEDMVETSSEEDPYERSTGGQREGENDTIFHELQYFQEAEKWEPWLGTDGGVLDNKDMEFLFPSNFKYKDSMSSQDALEEIYDTTGQKPVHEGDNKGRQWLPYVTAGQGYGVDPSSGFDSPRLGGSQRHTSIPQVISKKISKGIEKLGASKRMANSASKEIGGSKRMTNCANPNSNWNPKDEDENIYPSVKSWEVEDEGPRLNSISMRGRWRQPRSEKPPVQHSFSTKVRSTSFIPSATRRSSAAQLVPCTGRLFMWPHRIISGKSRFIDSDDESPVVAERGFGGSARRDAQQMKRILKGSQKKYADLSVDDILKQDFG